MCVDLLSSFSNRRHPLTGNHSIPHYIRGIRSTANASPYMMISLAQDRVIIYKPVLVKCVKISCFLIARPLASMALLVW